MKKIVFLILITCFSTLALAQEEQTPRDIIREYMQNYLYQQALDLLKNQEPTSESLYQTAMCHKALGGYSEATGILESLAATSPESIRLKSELAASYKSLSMWKKSAECYSDLMRLDTANVYFSIQFADMIYNIGNYPLALEKYNEILQKQDMKSLYKSKAQCFENMNILDSAMTYYLKTWNWNKDDAYALANFANLSLKQGNPYQAQIYTGFYMERDSTHRAVNRLNALSYYSLNHYEKGAELFEKCFANGDSTLIVERSLGFCYYSLNNSDKAHQYLTRAYAKDTANNNVLYMLAVTSNDLLLPDDAIQYFNTLQGRIIPPDVSLYMNYKGLGSAYEKKKEYKEASDYYKKSLTYAGQNQRMYMYYDIANICREKLKDDREALFYYKQYQHALKDYMSRLEKEKAVDEKEIMLTQTKLKHLDTYVKELEASLNPPS